MIRDIKIQEKTPEHRKTLTRTLSQRPEEEKEMKKGTERIRVVRKSSAKKLR